MKEKSWLSIAVKNRCAHIGEKEFWKWYTCNRRSSKLRSRGSGGKWTFSGSKTASLPKRRQSSADGVGGIWPFVMSNQFSFDRDRHSSSTSDTTFGCTFFFFHKTRVLSPRKGFLTQIKHVDHFRGQDWLSTIVPKLSC